MVAQPEKGRREMSVRGAKASETARLKRIAAAEAKNLPIAWRDELSELDRAALVTVRNHCDLAETVEFAEALGLRTPGGVSGRAPVGYISMNR